VFNHAHPIVEYVYNILFLYFYIQPLTSHRLGNSSAEPFCRQTQTLLSFCFDCLVWTEKPNSGWKINSREKLRPGSTVKQYTSYIITIISRIYLFIYPATKLAITGAGRRGRTTF